MINIAKLKYFKGSLKGIDWLRTIFFFVLFYFSYPLLEGYYSRSSLSVLLSDFKIDSISGIVLVLVPISIVIKKVISIIKGLRPKLQRLLGVIIFGGIYYWHWRFSDVYEFNLISSTPIAWFDLIPLTLCLLFLKMKTYQNLTTGDARIGLSYPDRKRESNLVEDLYYRTPMAKNIGNLISNSFNNEGATVIGVFSEWGAGKTDFLERLSQVLSERNNTNEVIWFNPWKYSAGEGIIQSFFKTFKLELEAYDDDIDSLFSVYIKEIMGKSRSFDAKFIQTLMLSMFDENEDLTVQQKIKDTLNSTGKRFVIYIDDIDRLTGREIIEVFKLVRVIADFPNVFFVVTMDYNYVVKTVEKTNEIDNVERYLKKIFNVTFRLPVIKHETIGDQIIKLAKKDFNSTNLNIIQDLISTQGKSEINNGKEIQKGLLEKCLLNSRDVFEFYNSFRIQFINLSKEVNITDLFLLELLKVYSFEVYNLISIKDSRITLSDQENVVEGFSEETGNELDSSVLIDGKVPEDPVLKELLDKLYRKENPYLNRFTNPINYYLYFSYCLPSEIISREELASILSKESDELFLEQIVSWASLKSADTLNVLIHYPFKEDKKTFIKFLKAYLKVGQLLGINSFVYVDFANELIGLFEASGLSSNDQKLETQAILSDKSIGAKERIQFAKVLSEHQVGENKIFGSGDELLEIMQIIFRDELAEEENLSKTDMYDMLILIVDSSLSKIEKDEKIKAFEYYRSHLKNNHEFLSEYIKIFFRKNWDGFSDIFYIVDPYFFKIFENPQEFKDLINEQTFEDKTVQRLSKIISGIENNKFIVELPILKNGDKGYDYVHKLYSEQQNQTENEGLFKF